MIDEFEIDRLKKFNGGVTHCTLHLKNGDVFDTRLDQTRFIGHNILIKYIHCDDEEFRFGISKRALISLEEISHISWEEHND